MLETVVDLIDVVEVLKVVEPVVDTAVELTREVEDDDEPPPTQKNGQQCSLVKLSVEIPHHYRLVQKRR